MQDGHVIAFDTHCAFTEAVVMTARGRIVQRRRVATTIPALRALIGEVRRPRYVVLEESTLADWLVRELRGCAEEVLACDPRRNAHISKDGDKDDPIDAEKLAQLYRGGFIRGVHHAATAQQAAFKQLVGLYHDRVRNVVRHANRIGAQFRQQGIFVRQGDFARAAQQRALLARLPLKVQRIGLQVLFEEWGLARMRLDTLRGLLVRQARPIEPIRRFIAVPGIQWVRAATFYAYVDTPWRFASKQALWRYLGIGLERRHSGAGRELLRVPASVKVCRPLKNMIVGAARRAIAAQNPFAERYKEWCHAGISPRNAVRNVARSLAATLWGMFKTGSVYHPEWVGVDWVAVSRPAGPQTAG